jgi:hypothetical protein
MAKPMPIEPPDCDTIAVLIPTRLPRTSISAPPELPWLIAASVWMKFSNTLMPRPERSTADTIPAVTVCPTPSGLPIASTMSPTRKRLGRPERDRGKLVGLDAQHGQVGLRIGADDLREQARAVGQRDLDFVGRLHHVVVREDVAARTDDHAGAEAGRALRAEKTPEQRIIERRLAHFLGGEDAHH